MHFMNRIEEARVQKIDGSIKGPYKAKFAGDTIFIDDPMADVAEGDCILRELPNGNTERSFVTLATYYKGGIGGMGPHFQIKFSKTEPLEHLVQNINISHAQGIQVGNNNNQSIRNVFESIAIEIDSSTAPPAEKEEAKTRLKKLLEHPLVAAIVGAGIGVL